MKQMKSIVKDMQVFLKLWSTQALSELGSSMTSFALILWAYEQSGSALMTALLSICTYAPYVICSMFTGAMSEHWNKKKTMLLCDSIAAISTLFVFLLYQMHILSLGWIYLLNLINGFMNSMQQPASEVATTLLIPKQHYQKASALLSFSQSLNTILTPLIATMLFSYAGMQMVFLVDFITFLIAFITLMFKIKIPQSHIQEEKETMWIRLKQGFIFLKTHKTILYLIYFLAAINLCASMYQGALPAMVLLKTSEIVLGNLNAICGIASAVGSILAFTLPKPKSRIHVICNCLLFSMSTENLLLAFSTNPWIWYLGGMLGWLFIPVMNANLNVLLREEIPLSMQSRVYACRNALQFFTIPVGYLLSGVLIDQVLELYMASLHKITIFGIGKGSGAALLYAIIAVLGISICLIFRKILKSCD